MTTVVTSNMRKGTGRVGKVLPFPLAALSRSRTRGAPQTGSATGQVTVECVQTTVALEPVVEEWRQ